MDVSVWWSVVLARYERAERTRDLIRKGLLNKEIAALTGASHSSVCNIRNRMNRGVKS